MELIKRSMNTHIFQLLTYNLSKHIKITDVTVRDGLQSYNKIKVLGLGEVKDKISLKVDYISKSAMKKLEKIGGVINIKKKD